MAPATGTSSDAQFHKASISERIGTRRNVSDVRQSLSIPASPIDWRLLEARYWGVLTRESHLVDVADVDEAIERAELEVSNERLALEDVILETRAVDIQSLAFKLRVFDPNIFAAETHWRAIRDEIFAALSAFKQEKANG